MTLDTPLPIDGAWRAGTHAQRATVRDPATGAALGELSLAGEDAMALALEAARRGFELWRRTSAYERARILGRAADLLRERAQGIAALNTREQGKPLAEARMEAAGAGNHVELVCAAAGRHARAARRRRQCDPRAGL